MLETQALDQNSQVGLVYSDVDIIDEEGTLRQEHYLARRFQGEKITNPIIGPHTIPFPSASLKRRDIFEKAGCFDVTFYQGGEDLLLLAKMYHRAGFFWTPESLAQRRGPTASNKSYEKETP